jgi:hypothetical protein
LVTSDLLTARRGDLLDFFVAVFFVAVFFVAVFFVAVFFGDAFAADLVPDLAAAPVVEALFTGSACATVFSRRALGSASAPASNRTATERSDRALRLAWADCPLVPDVLDVLDVNFSFMRLGPFR